jgi:putative transposase
VLDGDVLSLSQLGRIPMRLHRPLAGTPKTVTLSKEVDGWYPCVSCAEVPTASLPQTGRETGIDVGLKQVLITAQGEVCAPPCHYRRGERRMAGANKRVARRKTGSKRRGKAVTSLGKAQQTVKRQRADCPYKTARPLLRQYDIIYLEDVPVATRVRTHRRAENSSAAGWMAFRTIRAAKQCTLAVESSPCHRATVPPAYTSQDCSGCGERVPQSLAVRTQVCPNCGLVMGRDENAARNIHWAGQALRGRAGLPAGTNREAPCL